jgi:FixJ family two-component response regulator
MDRSNMASNRLVHIVDDDPKIRDSLSLLLSTVGIDCRSYSSAEEFLEAGGIVGYSCVILDNQLTGANGLSLLREMASGSDLPRVIMITGYGDVPTAVAAMRAGAFHFVEKPFDAASLLAIVDEALAEADRAKDNHLELREIKDRHASLTRREQEVLELLVEGMSARLIGARLSISSRTVEHHRAAILQKMKAKTVSHLVRMSLTMAGALKNGIKQ